MFKVGDVVKYIGETEPDNGPIKKVTNGQFYKIRLIINDAIFIINYGWFHKRNFIHNIKEQRKLKLDKIL